MSRIKKGFTLIELLIVIAIILILIAIALPNFLEAQIRAKVTKAAGEIRTLSIAQEAYRLDWNQYTQDCAGSLPNPFVPGCFQLTSPVAYISQLPEDPFGSGFRQSGSVMVFNGKEIPLYPMATGMNPSTERKGFPTGYPPPFTRDQCPICESYMIYSAGPSDEEPGNPTGPFPLFADPPPPGSTDTWIVYAATNGTKSFGGIIRTGGAPLELPQLKHLNRTTHN
jgi:type II secretion system protein G